MNRPTPPLVGRSILSIWAPKTSATTEARTKESHSCKPLHKEFRRNGFNNRQIAREGDVAIYEQRWTGCPDAAVCFEVICVRRREGFQIGVRFVQPAEVYPKSEAWGVDGFTVTDRKKAWDKFFRCRWENQQMNQQGKEGR